MGTPLDGYELLDVMLEHLRGSLCIGICYNDPDIFHLREDLDSRIAKATDRRFVQWERHHTKVRSLIRPLSMDWESYFCSYGSRSYDLVVAAPKRLATRILEALADGCPEYTAVITLDPSERPL